MVCKTFNYEPAINGLSNGTTGHRNGLVKTTRQTRIRGLVLNERQMDFLRNKPYMYNCYVGSIMETLFLQKFWYFVSRFVPGSIAPCTITCVGLIINVISSAILLYYSPDSKQIVPNWPFLVCAIGLFIYQLFDALDGKQAVKVQDTPIEEVYDHGCDAVSALFVTLSIAIATRLGEHPLMQFIFFLVPLIAFYMTHYSCHVTRVMVFGRLDVIEGQWVMIAIHALTYFFGQNIWKASLFYDMTVVHILFVLTIISLIGSIFSNMSLILGMDSPMDKYIRIPRKCDKTKWNPMVSLIIIIVLAIIGFENKTFETNPILFIFIFGLTFAKLSFKLQMMNVTHEDMPQLDSGLIGPIVLSINTYFQFISLNTSLLLTLCYALLDYSIYFILVSIDMKKALDLNIFTLKYPAGHEKCRNKNYGFNLNGTENTQALRNMEQYRQLVNNGHKV